MANSWYFPLIYRGKCLCNWIFVVSTGYWILCFPTLSLQRGPICQILLKLSATWIFFLYLILVSHSPLLSLKSKKTKVALPNLKVKQISAVPLAWWKFSTICPIYFFSFLPSFWKLYCPCWLLGISPLKTKQKAKLTI